MYRRHFYYTFSTFIYNVQTKQTSEIVISEI